MIQKRLIKRPEVSKLTGLSRSSIYLKVSTGEFPKPIKLSQRSIAWVLSDIESWIDAKINESRQRGGVK